MFKYLLSFLFLFFVTVSSYAQITINSNGKVAIAANPSNSYQVVIKNNTSGSGGTTVGLRAQTTAYSFYEYGVQGISSGGSDIHYGVYGEAEGGTWSGYGVYGLASGPNGTNYGVYGKAVGGSLNWGGYFNGNVYTTGNYSSSDARFKTNIRALDNAAVLNKVMQLQPRRYSFKSEEILRSEGLPVIITREGDHLGLLAQEVEQVFPDLVIDVPQPLNEHPEAGEKSPMVTTKALSYQELTIALLAAVQELQQKVEVLEAELSSN